ncbi:MAG: hypothetical protein JJE46_11805 [Acidimicrobiia bacterium]|nr:hypothetical protein [Acidimicrobiia bacterium]
MKPSRHLVVVALLVVLAAACSSGSSSTTGEGSTSTSRAKRRHPKPTTTTESPSSTSSSSTTTASTEPAPPATAPPPTAGPGCGGRAGPIFAAVQGGDLGPVPLASYTIADCRIADANPIWAAVTLVPNPGANVIRLTVVLQRLGSIWTVFAYGAGPVGCNAPPPVPDQLQLGC